MSAGSSGEHRIAPTNGEAPMENVLGTLGTIVIERRRFTSGAIDRLEALAAEVAEEIGCHLSAR